MRAGKYVKQLDGYRAFIPAPLPPVPPLEMDRDLTRLLSEADHALGRLDGVTAILPNPDLFVSMNVRHEAVLSSQIEGTQSTLEDVLQFEIDGIRNDGHWEAWLKFFLKGVGEVSRSATETARRILELRQKHLALIRKQAVNQANAAGLLDYLFEQPIVTPRLRVYDR
jgi:Fic family protein